MKFCTSPDINWMSSWRANTSPRQDLRPRASVKTASISVRVARRPVFNRTVRYFDSLSGIKKMIAIGLPDNTCVNIAQYFVLSTLELPVSGIFERAT